MTLHGPRLPTPVEQQPPVQALAPFGAVSVVALPKETFFVNQRAYRRAGLKLIWVCDGNTFASAPTDVLVMRALLAGGVHPDYLVLGNEADQMHESQTSGPMEPVVYAGLWVGCEPVVRALAPSVKLCLFGSVSGLPVRYRMYYDTVVGAGGRPDVINVHPWAKSALEAENLLDLYRQVLPGLPLMIGEWNREADEIPGYVQMLERSQPALEAAVFFSWLPFDTTALLDAQGQPTERYHAYVGAIPEPTPGGDMPEFIPGHDFARFAAAHPEVGKPLSEEVTLGTAQLTEGGLLVYLNPPAAQTVLLPWAVIDAPPTPIPPTPIPPVPDFPEVAVIDNRFNLPTRPGADPYSKRPLGGLDSICVHYTAGAASATVLDIARYHTGPEAHLKFPAIAYHYFVEQDGVPHWCHPLDVYTWGSDGAGENARAVHVCYAGNTQPNNAQLQGIKDSIMHAQWQLKRELSRVIGHKDTDATQCPGSAWPAWKAAILP